MASNNFIAVKGVLDGPAAEALAQSIGEGAVCTLDFSEVTEVKFAGLRALLRCRQAGKRMFIINAPDNVAEKFEDTGVAALLNICRKPKALDMSKYIEFGASFMSKAYNSDDGDAMIKVYPKFRPAAMVAREKAVARAALLFGLNTPLVGTMYEDENGTALEFERVTGKRSFSRIISEEPERTEEISRRFARMCKELHSTPCDTNIFTDRSTIYRQTVANCKEISEDERKQLFDFLDSVPAVTTCLHGDMQLSNVITTGKEDMWIDLGDFGYGNPMYDMGMLYFLSILNTEERAQNLFHMGKAELQKTWDFFIDEYFGADTPEKKAEINSKVEKFAALHMMYLGVNYGYEPGMVDIIRGILF